jgi:hypothetical protein
VELPLPAEQMRTVFKAFGNGLALEKIADPDGVRDELYGDFLAFLFSALENRQLT